jgi:stage IV sporulation protein B
MLLLRAIKRFIVIALFVVLTPLVIAARDIVPGGQNIGMEIRTNGLIISGTYDVKVDGSTYNPATDSDINKGDLLVKAEGKDIRSVNDLVEVLKNTTKNSVSLELNRNDKVITRNLKIIRSSPSGWKTGLFIKERILGVGTITFYDPSTNTYGALGHEVVDSSSSRIVEVSSGTIFESKVVGIKKSENGKPGEKIAELDESKKLGNIVINNRFGIYGTYKTLPKDAITLPSGKQEDVKLGEAEIWTVISGNAVEKYAIEIISVRPQTKPDTKGMTFKVTDERLLSQTNGIIQGMSGSPIIQNGKVIGAVTHVIVDKVHMGHGIYIEWMLMEADQVVEGG